MKDKEINIILEEWDYTCGDGCCYNYGTTLKVDDIEITNYSDDNIEDTLIKLLTYLGYKVNIKHLNSR